MTAFKGINLLVRFLLEIGMLASVSYWGFKTHPTWTARILFAVGLPVLIAVVWGRYMAPRSTQRLSGIPFTAMDMILLGSGAVALYASGLVSLSWIYAVVLVISETLRLVWKQ